MIFSIIHFNKVCFVTLDGTIMKLIKWQYAKMMADGAISIEPTLIEPFDIVPI